jgi:RNA polymerase sigma factor (sigma-70 family)
MDENLIQDKALAENVKAENCEKSLCELISRHSPLCFTIYKKYSPAIMASGHCVHEVSKEKDFYVYKAAKSFDPTRNVKFSTWLGNQIKYHCLNVINNNRYLAVDEKDLDYLVNNHGPQPQKNYKDDLEFVFNILNQLKDKRIKQVFELRYFDKNGKKAPWAKIAKTIKASTQTAINLHERGIKVLNKKMKGKHQWPDKI